MIDRRDIATLGMVWGLNDAATDASDEALRVAQAEMDAQKRKMKWYYGKIGRAHV
jgi:hypothetical protein